MLPSTLAASRISLKRHFDDRPSKFWHSYAAYWRSMHGVFRPDRRKTLAEWVKTILCAV
jgi:hypothetical protein